MISGNAVNGILLYDAGIANVVAGNLIGLDATGTIPLGNGGDGVRIMAGTQSSPQSSRIGSNLDGVSDAVEANRIAFNAAAGVNVSDAGTTGNAIRRNFIYSNGGLGIDLSGGTQDTFGVTGNDPDDVDSGPNNLQNFPVLSLVEAYPANRLVGSLNTTADTTFTIDVFADSQPDASGFGEGKRYLSSFSVTTDAIGYASIDEWIVGSVVKGEAYSVTATAPNGDTSEFSEAELAVETFNSNSVINQFPPTYKVGLIGQPATSCFCTEFRGPGRSGQRSDVSTRVRLGE